MKASALHHFTVLRPLRTEENCAKSHRTDSEALESFGRKVGKLKDAVSESAELEGLRVLSDGGQLWNALAETRHIAAQARADLAKNVECRITLSALYFPEIIPI